MKRMVFSLSFLLFVSGMYAQITLEECQRKTQENYPLVHQYGLVEKTKEYNLENAAKGYLPQFALSAKASYQSDVTELPVKIPGVELKRLPKDQYQVMLELQQKIWDGGGIRMQKKKATAEAEIDRENRIITDLLTLVKMDKKSADLQISHMDINQLLEDILKRLRPIADKRNIDLILDSFRPVEADVDELKFTSAISNLVENAIKYNVDDGWVRVSLDADHKFFYVTVADSGMGIPEDSIDRIFERFYRVDKSHSREIGGTGLGLAIVKEAVQAHGENITVVSTEGVGTEFSFSLPKAAG